LRQRPDGVAEFQDTQVSGTAISIGSSADSSIQLLGRTIGATHAQIKASGSKISVTCLRGFGAKLNDKPITTAPVKVGDTLEIGGHRLKLITPPGGFDVAIEVQLDTSVPDSEFERAYVTDLASTGLSKRAASWMLIGLVSALAFAIPLATIYLHRGGTATPPGVPDDTVWTSGPLSAAHQHAAGKKCGACHEQLFVHVRDSACRNCHKTINDHVTPDHIKLTSLGETQRCAQCHREHDNGASRLVINDDYLCVACHEESARKFGSLKVQKVAGFSQTGHPAFSVRLQKLRTSAGEGALNPDWVGERVPLARAFEQSNLKFSHVQHLDAGRVTRAGGGGLGCGDCHIPAADGQHFLPVSMAKTCSSCHELNFDPSAPNRQLPHGKPVEAMLMIEDYFTRKAFDPPPVNERVQLRRLPDFARDPSRDQELDACNKGPKECARLRIDAEIENQFARRGCVSCHVVVDTQARDVHERYQVTPVRLGFDYFPEVRFSHKSHQIQGKLTGDAACESCHAARRSKQSRDLLVPDIDNCLVCHRDKHSRDTTPVKNDERKITEKITLQCVSCHLYHPAAIMSASRGTEEK
jgi:predicted CXXCH cytochrome family protein